MRGNLIKKVITILLSIVIFMYLFSGIVSADTPQIDLNSLQNISETIQTTNENDTTSNTSTDNRAEEENDDNRANTPHVQAGSNTETTFVVGLTLLIGTTIFIYTKTKIV
ncbi:MAG: hypothetical protein J6A89_07190 [Clostridia bacterium]|nr:hypothetical protein [Clostridia bacterium]